MPSQEVMVGASTPAPCSTNICTKVLSLGPASSACLTSCFVYMHTYITGAKEVGVTINRLDYYFLKETLQKKLLIFVAVISDFSGISLHGIFPDILNCVYNVVLENEEKIYTLPSKRGGIVSQEFLHL